MLPSGLPENVAAVEKVVRQIFDPSWIEPAAPDGKQKPAAQAFYPVPGHVVFSVSRELGLKTTVEIERNGISIGEAPLASGKSGRVYKGFTALVAGDVRGIPVIDNGKELRKLDVLADEIPPSGPYHAHVSGFAPVPEAIKRKEFYKNIGEDLRSFASDVHLRTLPLRGWEEELWKSKKSK